jgi:uncharacterized SAM-binding protein YcdF (DUF218 family)
MSMNEPSWECGKSAGMDRCPRRIEILLLSTLLVFAISLFLWIISPPDRSNRDAYGLTTGGLESDDVIVVLAGDADRRAHASFLVRQALGARVLSTRIWPHCTQMDHPSHACRTGVRNTVDEALVMHRILSLEDVRQATVVTSRYHLMRATAVFRVVFIGSGIRLRFAAPPDSEPASIRVAMSELLKFIPSIAAAVVGRLAPDVYESVMRHR